MDNSERMALYTSTLGEGGCHVLRFIKTEGSNSCWRRREKTSGLVERQHGHQPGRERHGLHSIPVIWDAPVQSNFVALLAGVCDRHTAGDERFGISLGWGWEKVE